VCAAERAIVDDDLDPWPRGAVLLGMTVMTDGLKGLAGSALRNVLDRAAATPLRGAWWGAVLREGRGRSSRLPLGGRRAPVSRLSA